MKTRIVLAMALLVGTRADSFLQAWRVSAPDSEARFATEVTHHITRGDLVAA